MLEGKVNDLALRAEAIIVHFSSPDQVFCLPCHARQETVFYRNMYLCSEAETEQLFSLIVKVCMYHY